MLSPKLKEMFRVAAELPVAAQILSELSELLLDVRAETAEVCALLRQDGPLASAMLRIANSPYYGAGGLGSMEQAVNRVGFREVHRLVGRAVTGLVADRALPFYRIEPETMREHMIAVGFAAEFLASRTQFNPRHAFTAGLLRPIGMLVLDRMARTTLSSDHVFRPERDLTYGDWESRVMDIRNAAVSTVILTEWRFSQDVIEAVRSHRPLASDLPSSLEAAVLHLALHVAEQWGQGLPGEAGLWEPTAAKLELAGLTTADLSEAAEHGRRQLDGVKPVYSAS